MSYQAPQPPESDRPPRVPIPRLERRAGTEAAPSPPRSGNIHRVSRACVACRRRKVRCDGGRPQCQNCLDKDKPCVYMQSRRHRLKTATEQNQEIISFLEDLKHSVTENVKQQIDNLLDRVTGDVSDAVSSLALHRSPESDDLQGEDNVSAEVGSNGDLDSVDEDSRATGFIGKSSELQWLRRLQVQVDRQEDASTEVEGPYGPPGDKPDAAFQRMEASKRRQEQNPGARVKASTSSFYLDNGDIDINYTVDPYALPPLSTAQKLFNSYMDTVQDSFPLLPRVSFTENFHAYYASVTQGTPFAVPNMWLAILNLVFAIGAKYSHLAEADWRADDGDHLVYQSRAHILGLYGSSLVFNPDLMLIQVTALYAFYLMTMGRVNRAWVVVGTALRCALALGLHIRNEDRTATIAWKETLLHIWWGLYSLEGLLGTMVGRPSFIMEDFCSAPLPLPLATEHLFDETLVYQFHERYRATSLSQSSSGPSSTTSEPSNAGSYLKSRVQIGMITQRAINDLYSAKVIIKSWKHVQQTMSALCDQLEAWLASLPSGLNFTKSDAGTSFRRERLILEMHYIGTKILITRPCLCRLDSRIANQTKASDNFNRQTAQTCVNAAKTMADLHHADACYLYQTGPWWSLVHNLMQALIVLLLEMSYGTVHFSQNGEEILPSAKTLIRSLRTMKKNNQIAERAYTTAFGILRRLAPRINADISDLLGEDVASSGVTTRPNTEDGFTTGEYVQRFSFPAGEDNQQLRGQEMFVGGGGFYDFQSDHTSMFAFPSGATQQG